VFVSTGTVIDAGNAAINSSAIADRADIAGVVDGGLPAEDQAAIGQAADGGDDGGLRSALL
jgi:hypothetical protein